MPKEGKFKGGTLMVSVLLDGTFLTTSEVGSSCSVNIALLHCCCGAETDSRFVFCMAGLWSIGAFLQTAGASQVADNGVTALTWAS